MCVPGGPPCAAHGGAKAARRKATTTTTKSHAPGFLGSLFSGAGTGSALSSLAGLNIKLRTKTCDDGKSFTTGSIEMPEAKPAWAPFEYIAKLGELPDMALGGVFGDRTLSSLAPGLLGLGALAMTNLNTCEDTATEFAKSCASTFWSNAYVDYVSSLSPSTMAYTAGAAAAIAAGTYAYSKWNTSDVTKADSADALTDRTVKKAKIVTEEHHQAKEGDHNHNIKEADNTAIESRGDGLSKDHTPVISSDANTTVGGAKTLDICPEGCACSSSDAGAASKALSTMEKTVDAAAKVLPVLLI